MKDIDLASYLRKYISELRGNPRLDPRAIEYFEWLDQIFVNRSSKLFEPDERKAADLLLQYLMRLKNKPTVHPPPIDFSHQVFKAPWLQKKNGKPTKRGFLD